MERINLQKIRLLLRRSYTMILFRLWHNVLPFLSILTGVRRIYIRRKQRHDYQYQNHAKSKHYFLHDFHQTTKLSRPIADMIQGRNAWKRYRIYHLQWYRNTISLVVMLNVIPCLGYLLIYKPMYNVHHVCCFPPPRPAWDINACTCSHVMYTLQACVYCNE